jgi:hypothetical protein
MLKKEWALGLLFLYNQIKELQCKTSICEKNLLFIKDKLKTQNNFVLLIN